MEGELSVKETNEAGRCSRREAVKDNVMMRIGAYWHLPLPIPIELANLSFSHCPIWFPAFKVSQVMSIRPC